MRGATVSLVRSERPSAFHAWVGNGPTGLDSTTDRSKARGHLIVELSFDPAQRLRRRGRRRRLGRHPVDVTHLG